MRQYKKYYWLNDDSRTFLSRGYLLPGETAEGRIRVIAEHAEKLSGVTGFADKFEDYMSRGWFSLASPVWSNYGTSKGLPVSCFGSYVPDTMEGILGTHSEVGMMTKFGGGTSGYFGDLRPRGAPIGDNGSSFGAVHFMELFDKLMTVTSQGSVRRGYFAAYYDIEGDDFDEFVTIGSEGHPIQNLTHGVCVGDEFLNKVISGDSEARRRWAKVIQTRSEVGYPYIFFRDTVNRGKPEVFEGQTLYSSNLCVAPETLILTDEGYQKIGSLQDQKVKVWNGLEFSKTTVRKTGENQKLLRVTFSDGSSIDCTPYHKFYVQESYGTTPREYQAKDLYTGAKMEKFELPEEGLDLMKGQSVDYNLAYSKGFYAGDGNENYTFSSVYPEKHCVINRLVGTVSEKQDSCGRLKWTHGDLGDKFEVPFQYTLLRRLEWLAGLFDADGCVIKSNNCDNIQLVSTKPDFLRKIKLFLQEMGVHSSVNFRREEGTFLLPKNDGTGCTAEYQCQELWVLGINGQGVKRLLDLGLKTSRLEFSEIQNPQRSASKFVTVVSVEDTGRISDTFCFTEEKRNKGMFNGILTGQCSEICLPQNENESFTCVLSSMNLLHWDEWKDTDAVETMIIFLNTVCDEFIHKIEDMKHTKPEAYRMMSRALNFTIKYRALGLGVLGWHSYLQSKMIPFESAQAHYDNVKIFHSIKMKAEKASKKLLCDITGKNDKQLNATLLAVAPTKSSSFILGSVSQGIEPIQSNYFVKDLAKVKEVYKNPYLVELLETKGKNTPEVWESILYKDGSVQHLEFLTEQEKDVFKTFEEISPQVVINQAAERQKFIDQSQSLNLMISPEWSAKQINALYLDAWKKGVKTLYYQKSKSAAQDLQREKITEVKECSSCEA